MGRPIIKKQTGYGFYRPAAVQIANTLADLPFSATRILIYDIIIYFMTHLARSAGGFFTFHLVNYTALLTMQGFFRTIGLFCSNYHTALRVAVSIFPNLALYAGYMIPVNQMKRWLFWVVRLLAAMVSPASHYVLQSYINPVSYAWSALMENEFRRITVSVLRFSAIVVLLKLLCIAHMRRCLYCSAQRRKCHQIPVRRFFLYLVFL